MTVATEQYMYISLRVVGNKLCPQLHELMAYGVSDLSCMVLSCLALSVWFDAYIQLTQSDGVACGVIAEESGQYHSLSHS